MELMRITEPDEMGLGRIVYEGRFYGIPIPVLDYIASLEIAQDEKQAKIDALMLEYCPDEMTPEQTEEWGRNQRPVSDEQQRAIEAALGVPNAPHKPRSEAESA